MRGTLCVVVAGLTVAVAGLVAMPSVFSYVAPMSERVFLLGIGVAAGAVLGLILDAWDND